MAYIAKLVIAFFAWFGAFDFGLVSTTHLRKHQLDAHYNKTKKVSDRISFPNRRRTQLYSRNSGRHVQILSRGKVVAKGEHGDKYAQIMILSVSYGKVHIKGLEADRYVCFDRRGRLISRKRPSAKCVFHEMLDKDAYTMYKADKRGKFLAFTRRGYARDKPKNRLGIKAVQFVERPKPKKIKMNRYYRGKEGKITPYMLQLHKALAKQSKKEHGKLRKKSKFPGAPNPLFFLIKAQRKGKSKRNFLKPLRKRRRGRNNKMRKLPKWWLLRANGKKKFRRGRKRSNKRRGKPKRAWLPKQSRE